MTLWSTFLSLTMRLVEEVARECSAMLFGTISDNDFSLL